MMSRGRSAVLVASPLKNNALFASASLLSSSAKRRRNCVRPVRLTDGRDDPPTAPEYQPALAVEPNVAAPSAVGGAWKSMLSSASKEPKRGTPRSALSLPSTENGLVGVIVESLMRRTADVITAVSGRPAVLKDRIARICRRV